MISFGKFLAPNAVRDASWREASEITERWDVPHEVVIDGKTVPVPSDLDDTKPRWLGMRNGRRIAGRLLLEDMWSGAPSPAVPLAFGALPVIVIVGMLLASVIPPLTFVGVIAADAALWVIWRSAGKGWAALSTIFVGVAVLGPHGVTAALGALPISSPLIPIIGVCALAVVGLALYIHGDVSTHVLRLVQMFICAMIAVLVVVHFTPAWLHGLLVFMPLTALPVMYAWLSRQEWATELALQDIASSGETRTSSPAHIGARKAQAETAVRDGGPLIILGEPTGFMSDRQDGYAPDAGMPFGMSPADLRTHLAVIGETGSGKTSGILRVLIAQWAREQLGGLLVLDGKGQLASELRGLRRYKVIEPGVELALIEGLDENDLVEAIASVAVNRDKAQEGSSGFFQVNGQSVLYQGAVLLRALVRQRHDKWQWTLGCLHDMLSDITGSNGKEETEKLTSMVSGYIAEHPGAQITFNNAIKYFSDIAPVMDPQTRANIWSTIHGWLSPIFEHQELVSWSRNEHGVDISKISRGGMFGVALPAAKFGRAGVLIQALIKQRVFAILRARGDGWREQGEKQILFITDEAQELVGAGDEQFLPIARSLGGACVYASQSIDALKAKLGAGNSDAGTAWLGNLISQIVMHSTPQTMDWIAESLGRTRRPHFPTSGGYIRMERSVEQRAEAALYDASHPAASTMLRLRRAGAGSYQLGYKQTKTGQMKARQMTASRLQLQAVEQVSWEDGPLMTPAEVDAQLATPFVAIAQVRRGGVRRRDVIRLKPMFKFPADLLGGSEEESDEQPTVLKMSGESGSNDDGQSIRAPKPEVEIAPAYQPEAPKPEPEGVKL